MSDQQESNIRLYAEAKAEIKRLEAFVDSIRQEVKDEMFDLNGPNALAPVVGVGKLFFRERKIWQYPDEVAKAEDNVKIQEAKARQTGSATFQIEYDLTFSDKSDEQD